jgi:hypothetical protein
MLVVFSVNAQSLELDKSEIKLATVFLRNFKENKYLRIDFLERMAADPVRNERKWYVHYGLLMDMANRSDGYREYPWSQRRMIYDFLGTVFERLPEPYQRDIRILVLSQLSTELSIDYQARSMASYIRLLGYCGDASKTDPEITDTLLYLLEDSRIQRGIISSPVIAAAFIDSVNAILKEDREGFYLNKPFFKVFYRAVDPEGDGDQWRREHRELMSEIMRNYVENMTVVDTGM